MAVPMTPDEILRVRTRLEVLARGARDMLTLEELDDFIRTCERADTIGPFLDPTAWMKGHDQMKVMVEHARALRTFRKAIETVEVPA